MKHCNKCNTTKSLDEFNNNTKTFDGKRTQCKECDRAYRQGYLESGRRAIYTKANPVSYEDNKRWAISRLVLNPNYYRELRLKNLESFLLNSARHRAKKRGLEFNITKNDITIPDTCPVFGTTLYSSKGHVTDNSPTLDRIDNSKGYIKGNIQVISHRANSIKRDATIEELEKIIEYMKS